MLADQESALGETNTIEMSYNKRSAMLPDIKESESVSGSELHLMREQSLSIFFLKFGGKTKPVCACVENMAIHK